MRQRTADNSRRAVALALVVALHLALLWLLINSSTTYQQVRSITTVVRLITPEKTKPKIGATLRSPVIIRSVLILPKIEPPKVVVMIVKPTPQAPPAPAPAAAPSASSAPSLGDRTSRPAPLPPDDFTAYLKLVHNRMQAELDDITSARISQIPGTVIVALDIDRTGKILIWEIADTKHPPVFDYEIRELMTRSNPLPPFPANIRADHLITTTRVIFQEAGTANFGPPGFGP